MEHKEKQENRKTCKTCPCNIYPLIPHFYIAKLGYAGVNLFFLFLLQNIDCVYTLEPPRRGGSNKYPQSMFWSKNKKNIQKNLSKIFNFYNLGKVSIIIWACLRNGIWYEHDTRPNGLLQRGTS